MKPCTNPSTEEIPKDYYFTWGFGQGHDNCYTVIFGTRESSREMMTKLYGDRWGFQYDSAEAAGVKEYSLKRVL